MRSCPFFPIIKRTTPNTPYMTVNGMITEEIVSDDWVASVANDRTSTNTTVTRIILTNNTVFMVLISPPSDTVFRCYPEPGYLSLPAFLEIINAGEATVQSISFPNVTKRTL